MPNLNLEQRLQIIKIYYQNYGSVTATLRKLTPIFGRHSCPNKSTIQKLVNKFESTFSLHDVVVTARQRNARSEENIDMVRQSVAGDPNVSIPRRCQQLQISKTTLWRILREDLNLRAYKIALTQELKPADHEMRRIFSDWALKQLEMDSEFPKKIFFSDEAHFWLNGSVNKWNCRIWSATNPQVIHQKQLHSPKLSVWCTLHAGGIIGPYFFVNENGNTVTVNGIRYRSMLTEFFWPEINNIEYQNMWFQQDGATSHTARDTIDLLKEKFDKKIISRNGSVNWPPRSCDLTPLDFFLWGYVKSLVYVNKPANLDELRINIEKAIAEISIDIFPKVIENWIQRIYSCKRFRGGHLNDVVFHN